MSDILITNSVAHKMRIKASAVDDSSEEIEFHYGFLNKGAEQKAVAEGVLSSFFMSLITHDCIYLKPTDFNVIVNRIGPEAALKILDRKIVRIIFGLEEFVFKKNDNSFSIETMKFEWSELEGIDRRMPVDLYGKFKPSLIQYMDNSSVRSDGVSKLVLNELVSDFSRSSFRDDLQLTTSCVKDAEPKEGYRLLRISQCAQSLVIQNNLGIDSICHDAYLKTYADSKFGCFSDLKEASPVAVFEKVLGVKGLPNIYSLYDKGVLDIDDILKCRDKYSGGIFRKWFAGIDYDEGQLLSALMSPAKQSAASKFIRWLYPNVAGIINPFLGAGASVVDSYLVDRIVGGWRPSLFLDDVLKSTVDEKVRLFETKKKRDEIVSRFGSVGRNDSCPCQSGKKFKRCHGQW